jgi:hypothetical protein
VIWLRRLARWRHVLDRRRGRHIRRRTDPFSEACMLLPRTPPPPRAELEPWPPRITRWVRMSQPMPDDTVVNLPVTSLPGLLP